MPPLYARSAYSVVPLPHPPTYLQVKVAVPAPFSPPTNWLAVIVTGTVVAPTQVATTVEVSGSLVNCTFTVSDDVHITSEITLLNTHFDGNGDPGISSLAVNVT